MAAVAEEAKHTDPQGGNALDVESQMATGVDKSSNMKAGGGNYTLTVKDLSYRVKLRDTDKKSKEMTEKTIIHPVDFVIKPRQMLAIMGASGAGKSTLLDILATRIPQSAVAGEYLMNDKPVNNGFKRVSGYVQQDDALYPLLTVRETLQYAALLRIPNMSRSEKWRIVEETIDALRLGACADTIIGDDRNRGLSGGEKRRVSIGVDIVHQPSIIFLDEPTSGLDSTTALQIVETLKGICARDRTIAVTIHQPSSRVFEVFDKVMFFSKGHMVYNGAPMALGDHISTISKSPLPKFANVAELFLEVVDGYEKEGNVEALVEHRKQADRTRQPSMGVESSSAEVPHGTYANNPITESLILTHRNMRNVLRTPELFMVRIGLCVVMGLVLGSLFWDVPNTARGIDQIAGYIAFLSAFFLFTSLEALPIFLNERAVFAREHGRGAYRVSSYTIANFGVYLPFFAIMAVVFSSISFFMLNLSNSEGNFIFQIIMIFFILTAGNGFATFVSGFVPDALTGNGAGTAILAFMFLFSGFFIPKSAIPRGWIWVNAISMFRYPYEGLLKSNLDRLPEESADLRQEYIDTYDINDLNRWTTVAVMVGFSIGWRILFYAILRLKFSGAR